MSEPAPDPPVPFPPTRTVHVPGRGEFFLRDSGGDGPPVLLLHGWTVSADLNWYAQYGPLAEAGYRVLAIDHRGHGRGLRTVADFRLEDCADDAIGALRVLDTGPALLAGYSMGGPISLLAARRHPDHVRGLVLCATASNWRSPRIRAFWWTMALWRLVLQLAPYGVWRAGMRSAGVTGATWATGELVRGSARDIAEAGRELGRFDARPWLPDLSPKAAVVLTREDNLVPPPWQRELARRLDAPVVESPGDHLACSNRAPEVTRALLDALAQVVSSPPSTGSSAPVM